MLSDTLLRWWWMNILTRKRLEAITAKFGSLEKALGNVSLEMLRELGVREDAALAAMNRLEELDLEAYRRSLEARNVRLVFFEDEGYPERLREIEDSPMFLSFIGDLSILSEPCLALVGTREMSEYGKRVVEALVPEIVRSGLITVSGLAFGIDAEVARETVRSGGKTVAVLGHGLGMLYPKANEKLAKEIVKTGGLLLSEFPLDVRPDTYTFPARNRIIAGLSLGTVVVEAAGDSGSLITAELALDYNREVFAVPGQIFDPNFAGCHQLISRGHAKLVASTTDILTELGIVFASSDVPRAAFAADSPDEESVFSALTTMPAPIDDLAVKTKLDAATLGAVLTVLEIKGVVKNVGGGKWVRV